MKIDDSYPQLKPGTASNVIKSVRQGAAFLANLEIWLVGGAIAGSVAMPRFLPVAVGVAAAFWLVRWMAAGRLSVRTPADWPISLLVVMVPVTLWATALPEETIPQVLRLLTGAALFYSLANWGSSATRLRWLVIGMILAGLGLALMAPFSVEWFTSGKLAFIPSSIYERFTLLVADTVHPNVMGGYLAIFMPLSLAWLIFNWRDTSWVKRAGLVFSAVIMAGMIILTKSRGAWMALGGVLMLLILLRWRWGKWVLASVVLGAGIGIYLVGLNPVLEALSTSDTISGIDGRVEIWSRAIYMIQDFPFTGIGMGSFMRVADTLYPFFLMGPGQIVHAHNLFLQVTVDLGIPGFIAWVSILLLVVVAAWQVYGYGRVRNNNWIAGIGAGLLGSQLALVIHGITDAVTWGLVRPAPLIWGLWGLTMAAWYVYVYAAATHHEDPAQALV